MYILVRILESDSYKDMPPWDKEIQLTVGQEVIFSPSYSAKLIEKGKVKYIRNVTEKINRI
ncbi:hypothetical protein C9J48_26530 [Photobacterium profundum]|uniref:Uncharacterized protein n=1 Tax=Photobacterium profundum 3TCK TaxID=314280 RepID=Q1YYL3_9GAMM|nr:hypothetical protein [Photobacterium profundum]EAS41309.1 hypothetical protein P3TCK_07294 [Photobacterium profundum 3TCK]PSV57534.1 hypothetical protein C9J48_26530 [Photobacterium profundum]